MSLVIWFLRATKCRLACSLCSSSAMSRSTSSKHRDLAAFCKLYEQGAARSTSDTVHQGGPQPFAKVGRKVRAVVVLFMPVMPRMTSPWMSELKGVSHEWH